MKEQLIPPINRYFSEKSDFQCEHGMPLDSVCVVCEAQNRHAGDVPTFPHDIPRHITDSPFAIDASKVVVREHQNEAHNNGGKTDYYDLPKGAKCCQDIIEWREMNFQQGNIFKVAFTFNCGRHSGTDYRRDLNKIIYFAQRELERLTNENIRT